MFDAQSRIGFAGEAAVHFRLVLNPALRRSGLKQKQNKNPTRLIKNKKH